MRLLLLSTLFVSLLPHIVVAFSTTLQPTNPSAAATTTTTKSRGNHLLWAINKNNNLSDNHAGNTVSMRSRRQVTKSIIITALLFPVVGWAVPHGNVALAAADETTTAAFPSITPCRKDPSGGGVTNCVSTASVRQLDLYAPPWTFETSAPEAAARIKGVVETDANLELLESFQNSDNTVYLKVKATRNGGIFQDVLEFLVNPTDKVVTFRAEQVGEGPSVTISDFGAIRKQLESIRQRSQVFGVMGDGLMSADTAPSQNGPGGQLKAFFGYQSGRGFEDVFAED